MQEKFLGDYRIIKQMGRGSLGAVYLTEHRFIKKQYILKVLPEELSQDPAFIRRFETRMAQIATLDHPHIVKVHMVSLIEGSYFLVTEPVVDSTSLMQMLSQRKEPFSEEEILLILRQIADALDYAHAKSTEFSLTHGSLKFSNILFSKASLGLHSMLSDFGLFSIVGDNAIVSRSFQVMGEEFSIALAKGTLSSTVDRECAHSFLQSFAFFAPEQKLKFAPSSVQTDSYAFGVLAYYLLSGYFPEGYFPLPSEISKKYSFDFDALIKNCLSFHPEKRPSQLLPLLKEKKAVDLVSSVITRDLSIHEPSSASIGVAKSLQEGASSKAVQNEPHTTTAVLESVETTQLNPLKEESYTAALKAMLNRDPVVTHYQPQKKKTDNIEPISTDRVVIEGGRYLRGCNEGARDESPRHYIVLRSFAMDIHPITNEQFVRFLEFMGGEKDKNYHDLIRLKESRLYRAAGNLSIESGYAHHPVVGVTWYGAVAYAEWVHKRLPTEAEWEVAASGGLAEALYPTGISIEKSQANFFSSDTTAVKSYPPNGYGLYDMVGNVYEWCQDWYGYNYYETSSNEPNQPEGPTQGVYRVLRGGCWKSLKEDLRVSHRHRNNPGTLNGTYGFRCASDV